MQTPPMTMVFWFDSQESGPINDSTRSYYVRIRCHNHYEDAGESVFYESSSWSLQFSTGTNGKVRNRARNIIPNLNTLVLVIAAGRRILSPILRSLLGIYFISSFNWPWLNYQALISSRSQTKKTRNYFGDSVLDLIGIAPPIASSRRL